MIDGRVSGTERDLLHGQRPGATGLSGQQAGTQVEKKLLETTDEDWDLIDSTNVRAEFWSCKYAIPAMIASGGGSIVNMASVLSVLSVVGEGVLPAYAVSKHAVLGLTGASG